MKAKTLYTVVEVESNTPGAPNTPDKDTIKKIRTVYAENPHKAALMCNSPGFSGSNLVASASMIPPNEKHRIDVVFNTPGPFQYYVAAGNPSQAYQIMKQICEIYDIDGDETGENLLKQYIEIISRKPKWKNQLLQNPDMMVDLI
jgi:hypothetical protein